MRARPCRQHVKKRVRQGSHFQVREYKPNCLPRLQFHVGADPGHRPHVLHEQSMHEGQEQHHQPRGRHATATGPILHRRPQLQRGETLPVGLPETPQQGGRGKNNRHKGTKGTAPSNEDKMAKGKKDGKGKKW